MNRRGASRPALRMSTLPQDAIGTLTQRTPEDLEPTSSRSSQEHVTVGETSRPEPVVSLLSLRIASEIGHATAEGTSLRVLRL